MLEGLEFQRDGRPVQNAVDQDIEVSPAGLASHWPQIDVDFSVAGLVAGIFGTARFMEARRRGGQSRSAAKTAAARENGKKGGRPRKSA